MENQSDVAAVVDAVERLSTPKPFDIGEDGERTVFAMPRGVSLESIKPLLDEYRTRPERAKGVSTYTQLDSFIAHVNRFKDANTVIFADEDKDKPALLAVYDYNEKPEPPAEGEQQDEWARYGEHRARYSFPVSDEWRIWTSKDGEPFGQADFATFLEDRLPDVLDPKAAGETSRAFSEQLSISLAGPQKLMTLARGLSVHVDQRVESHHNLASGEGRVAFEETHKGEDGNQLNVPGGFALAIPVFRGGARYQICARLRYRARKGSHITWSYSLHRTDDNFQHAFDKACELAESETGVPLYYGQPEGSARRVEY